MQVNTSEGNIRDGHGGGDYGIMSNFIDAVSTGNQKLILTGPQETLESHLDGVCCRAGQN